jgi:NAD+ diphosphatase
VTHVHEQLSLDAHDRVALRRTDDEWLAKRWADPTTRVLVVAGARVLPTERGVDWVSPDEAPEGTQVLLGERDGTAYFATIVPAAVATDEWTSLRGVLSRLAEGEAPLVLHAIGIAEWLWSTRHCARCGGDLRIVKAGHEQVCDNGHSTFPRTDPAVIMLVTVGEPGSADERCLLGHQARWPGARYSTLAGFCEPGESLEDAVRREVAEETGIHVGEVAYFGNQPWPLPASLMLGFTARALDTDVVVDLEEISDARWFTRTELAHEAETRGIVLPGSVSISRSLIEDWYGGPLPGSW